MIRLRPSLAVLLERLKQARDARQAAFQFDGVMYQADPASLSAVLARAGVCQPSDTVGWIAADNKLVRLQGGEFIRMARAMAGHVDDVLAEFALKRNQIAAGDIVDPKTWEID